MAITPAAPAPIVLLCSFILIFGKLINELEGESTSGATGALGPTINYEHYRRQGRPRQVTRPRLSLNFNPNYGYDPYWPGGHWVFQKMQSTTEKQEGTLCGNLCPDLYKDYGIICGRNRNYTYRDFNNYCELVNYDCKGREKWMVVYRGKCKYFVPYPTKSNDTVTRASQFIYEFEYRLANSGSMPTTVKYKKETK